jgi:hypothetical protein
MQYHSSNPTDDTQSSQPFASGLDLVFTAFIKGWCFYWFIDLISAQFLDMVYVQFLDMVSDIHAQFLDMVSFPPFRPTTAPPYTTTYN